MKVGLCCIAKCENLYIREWISHYQKIGVDHITIYDNNDFERGEVFNDVISDYIDSGYVDIINVRGLVAPQMECYEVFYANNKSKYDWICYFDCDEFLYLNHDNNIKDYLSRDCFNDFTSILINWKIFDDNDLLDYDDRPLVERFTRLYSAKPGMFNENKLCKSIIKTCFDEITFDNNPHSILQSKETSCDDAGKPCKCFFCRDYISYELAELRHYRWKTIGEFVKIRMKNGRADFNVSYCVDDFINNNLWDERKEQYLKELLNKVDK